jgi:hypothetical protein
VTIIPEAEAAWIRTNVWPAAMRKTYRGTPGFFTSRACEYGLTNCVSTAGESGATARSAARSGRYVCGRTGEDPMYFGEPYEHPVISATGRVPGGTRDPHPAPAHGPDAAPLRRPTCTAGHSAGIVWYLSHLDCPAVQLRSAGVEHAHDFEDPGPGLPKPCGTRVSNSTASPAATISSSSPMRSRIRPAIT